jgi:polysaccharide pyruvyl transferase WcaK-like protein
MSKRYFFPRWIGTNRGDILSRYGLLKYFLRKHPGADVIVISNNPVEWFPQGCVIIPPGPLKDLFPRWRQLRLYQKGDIIVWACGQDMLDESSVLILPHMFLKFLFFKILGLKNFIVAQGAGPIKTAIGRFWIRCIVALAEEVSMRDRESLRLIQTIVGRESGQKCFLSADMAVLAPKHSIFKTTWNKPLRIGINLRRWFHLDGHWLPYEYRCRLGLLKDIPGEPLMQELLDGFSNLIEWLMERYNAHIVFVPMYPKNKESWEDDAGLAFRIIKNINIPEKVTILDKEIHPEKFLEHISGLDAMIGMRLHSTILATSCGIPSIHISYSPKGVSYFNFLKEQNYCLSVEKLANEKQWELLKIMFYNLWEERDAYRSRLKIAQDNAKRLAAKSFSFYAAE